jgi:hypothetical protein
MRHSAATIALDAGIALAVVQEMLGHSDIRVTRGYTHVSSLLAQAAAALTLPELRCVTWNCYENCYENLSRAVKGCAAHIEAGPLACRSICRCRAGGSRSRTPKAPPSGRSSLTARGTAIPSAAQSGT